MGCFVLILLYSNIVIFLCGFGGVVVCGYYFPLNFCRQRPHAQTHAQHTSVCVHVCVSLII